MKERLWPWTSPARLQFLPCSPQPCQQVLQQNERRIKRSDGVGFWPGLDARAPVPWTRSVLGLIEAHPGVRAGDLAGAALLIAIAADAAGGSEDVTIPP
jgi:hypothetical protein